MTEIPGGIAPPARTATTVASNAEQHSPAPWKGVGRFIYSADAEKFCIAQVFQRHGWEDQYLEHEANMGIIEAAPDMHRLLSNSIRYLKWMREATPGTDLNLHVDEIEALLKRLEGEK